MRLDDQNIKPFPDWHNNNVKVYATGVEAEKNGQSEFDCPVCGKKAHVEKSDYNGHLDCYCPFCKSGVIE